MTEAEFFAALTCEPSPAVDVHGNPIPELAGLYFKPLDVDDSLAVHAYIETHGKDHAYRIMFVRALVNRDGSRVLSDEAASRLGSVLAHVVGKAIPRIRQISKDDEDEQGKPADGQKKTSSTNGRISNISSELPVT